MKEQSNFFCAIAGNDAKRIMDEISLLAVLLSAEMILASHAPSNLENLVAYREKKPPVVPEEPEILRPDLRGEIQGNKVECLGCSKENKKRFFVSQFWNKHCRGAHMNQASQPDSEPPAVPLEEQPAGASSKKLVPAKKKVAKAGAAKKTAQPATQQAAQPAVQCIDSSVVGNTGELISTAVTSSPAKGSHSKRSSLSSRKESTVPSTKPVSKESQAGQRSNLVPRKNLECSTTFSDIYSKKNATKSK